MNALITDFTEAVVFDAARGEFIRNWEPTPLGEPPSPKNNLSAYSTWVNRQSSNAGALQRIDAIRTARNNLLAAVKRNGLSPVTPLHWYVVDFQKELLAYTRRVISGNGKKTVAEFEAAFGEFRREILDELRFNGVAEGDAAFETETDWVSKYTRDAPIILLIRDTSGNMLLTRFKQWEAIRLDQYVPAYDGR